MIIFPLAINRLYFVYHFGIEMVVLLCGVSHFGVKMVAKLVWNYHLVAPLLVPVAKR